MVEWENLDIQTITETWWDDSHIWSAQGMTINPSEGIMQERRGGGVTLDVFDCPELNDGNEKFVFKGKNREEGQRGRVAGLVQTTQPGERGRRSIQLER